ncbi:MAG: hypothetical protein AAFQ98_21535, partial [Bacteroidota bacterium]
MSRATLPWRPTGFSGNLDTDLSTKMPVNPEMACTACEENSLELNTLNNKFLNFCGLFILGLTVLLQSNPSIGSFVKYMVYRKLIN